MLNKAERKKLRLQLDAERERFNELEAQRKALLFSGDIETAKQVKQQWKDSTVQINRLYHDLYPHFPYSGTCSNCGSSMLPILGTNPVIMNGCIVCNQVQERW